MSIQHRSHQHNYEQRAKILPAEKILSRFGLKPNDYLADLGCGQGYFALEAAKIVGTRGKIKAVDIMPDRLQALQQTAQDLGIAERIETLPAEGESVPLPNKDVDVALIANVLHELNNPLNYLRDVQRILKNQGQLWVVEWQKKEMPMGPKLDERRSVEEWITLLEQAGFEDIWAQIYNPAHILIRGKGTNVN